MTALTRLLDEVRIGRPRPRPVIGDGVRTLSAREVFAQAARVAAWLERHTPQHTSVAIPIGDGLDWLALVVGALLAERVMLPYEPDARDEFTGVVARVRPAGFLHALGAGTAGIGGVDADRAAEVCRGVEFLPTLETARVFAPDACYIAVSSGSSGRAKAIIGSRAGLDQFLDAETALLHEITPATEFTTLRLAPASFDVFWRDVLLPLVSGGTLWCLDHFVDRRDPQRLANAIEAHHVTVVHIVPSLARALAPLLQQRPLPSLSAILFAGEPLHPRDVRPWLEHSAATPVNVYGTSETTLAKFLHVITAGDLSRERIPVGTCIPGAAAVAITDGRACYPGEPGEIHIATSAPIHGYLDTAAEDVFVPNPLAPHGRRVHRTGDLGIFDDAGVLQLLGRTDDMVKLRGHRIHVSDVERALRDHPQVTDCAVIVDHHSTDPLLYAYVVTDEIDCDSETLLDWLGTRLPAAAVPQALIPVATIPRGPRGKIDRQALRAHRARYAALTSPACPPDPVTATIVAAFREILPDHPEATATTSFRALGGQSIHAAQLSNRLADTGIDLGVVDVLTLRTPVRLAARAREHGVGGRGAPARRMTDADAGIRQPLTHAQTRFLRLKNKRGHQHAAFRYLWAATISGGVTADDLVTAVVAACREQCLHRLRIDTTGTEQYIDAVDHDVSIDEIPTTATHSSLLTWLTDWARHPVDEDTDPPIRFAVSRPPGTLILAVTGSVLWSDGGSKDALLRRITAHLAGQPPTPAPPSYTSYPVWEASWLASSDAARRLSFWRAELPPDLTPADPATVGALRTFGAGQTTATQWRSHTLPTDIPLFALARQDGATLNACVFWGFLQALQHIWPNASPLVMYPDPNRRVEESDIYGCLTETLLLDRTRMPMSSREGIAYVGTTIARGLDHALPLETVLRTLYPQALSDDSEPVYLPIMFAPQPALDNALHPPGTAVTVVATTSDLGELPFPILAAPLITDTFIELRVGSADLPGLPDIDALITTWRHVLIDSTKRIRT